MDQIEVSREAFVPICLDAHGSTPSALSRLNPPLLKQFLAKSGIERAPENERGRLRRFGLTSRASESCARRECHRSPLSRVWLGWRVEATGPPDLSNNRNASDRLWPSDGRLKLGLCTRRVDTSRLRSSWLQPSLGHGAFDNVPLDPSAMRAGKEAEVLASPARLNRRQLHW
jgi:hypothetical protein